MATAGMPDVAEPTVVAAPAARGRASGAPGYRVRRVVLCGPRRDRGSVTAELALGLPAVVLVLVAVLILASAAVAQVRCTDAARAAARAAALGEDRAAVVAVATALAGVDAQVTVSSSGGWVRVAVSRPVWTGWLGGGLSASAEFELPIEPGEP